MDQNKNYVLWINDHSGSMRDLAEAAKNDYNANIVAVKEAATREMQDTVVSVVAVGINSGKYYADGLSSNVLRQIQISNPHVLKPVTNWPTPGNTPLYDGIGNGIELLMNLPDANDSNVSFLVMVTTDGEEYGSTKYSSSKLRDLITKVSASEQWTFAFRIPESGNKKPILDLGIPEGNIQFWETTTDGLKASTVKTVAAVDTYYAARASGARSSNTFYADASQVNVKALEDISKKVSLYVVDPADNGIEIRDFVLKHRMEYLKGAAFYQFSKSEARISHTKKILIRDRVTGKVYAGDEARQMVGLPTNSNARFHPGNHGNFDLFIQSDSVNRKLVGGTGLLYWAEIGVKFTDADLAYLKPKVVNNVVQLPAVPVSNKPTPSPIPVTAKAKVPVRTFRTREEARAYCRANGLSQHGLRKYPEGWIV